MNLNDVVRIILESGSYSEMREKLNQEIIEEKDLEIVRELKNKKNPPKESDK